MTSLDVRNMTRRAAPRFPYTKAAALLLPGWELSLVFVSEQTATALNTKLRKKTYAPNVLSWKAGARHGEIVLCLAVAKKQAPSYDLSYVAFCGLLFIHACLHLKGYRHGTTMTRKERATLARFISSTRTHDEPQNRRRHRSRNASDAHRRR